MNGVLLLLTTASENNMKKLIGLQLKQFVVGLTIVRSNPLSLLMILMSLIFLWPREGISKILLTFIFLLLIVDSVFEAVLNVPLNKHQVGLIRMYGWAFALPGVLIGIGWSSAVLHDLQNLLFLGVLIFFLLFEKFRSFRWPIVLSSIILFSSYFFVGSGRPTLFLSSFLLMFIPLLALRHAETSPHIAYRDDEIDTLLNIYKKNKMLKAELTASGTPELLIIYDGAIYYQKSDQYFDKYHNLVREHNIILKLDGLVLLRKYILNCLIEEQIPKLLRNLYKQLPSDTIITFFKNKLNKSILKEHTFSIFLSGLFQAFIFLIFFDIKKMKMTSYHVYQHYSEKVTPHIKLMDSRKLWKSDYDLALIGQVVQKSKYKVLIAAKYFCMFPSCDALAYVQNCIRESKSSISSNRCRQRLDSRLSEAQKIYGPKSGLTKSFHWAKTSLRDFVRFRNKIEYSVIAVSVCTSN